MYLVGLSDLSGHRLWRPRLVVPLDLLVRYHLRREYLSDLLAREYRGLRYLEDQWDLSDHRLCWQDQRYQSDLSDLRRQRLLILADQWGQLGQRSDPHSAMVERQPTHRDRHPP